MDLADLAAGIVFKRIITGMQDYAECDVICPKMDEIAERSFSAVRCPDYKRLPYRVEKRLEGYQGFRISEIWWADYTFLKVCSFVRRRGYDGILSFVYTSNLAPFHLGMRLSQKTKLPWIVYSVDAIPAPIGWQADLELREKLHHHLNRYIPKIDALFSANPIMLEYEKAVFPNLKGFTGVLLTPCDGKQIQYVEHTGALVFLYAGHIYGPRRVDLLLSGFEQYHKTHPKDCLVFVGKSNESDFVGFDHLLESGVIERHGYTSEMESYYERADVLIDLNADLENDVFLSSKVCNYLSYDKPIVTISQDGSPVRAMMSGVESIIHSHHALSEITSALEKAAVMARKPITDREVLRRQFMPDEVTKCFCEELDILIGQSR